MDVMLTIPDNFAEQLAAAGQDPARAALEALVIEGYRSRRLSEFQVRQMLGFATRMDVHGFLKEHGAYMHYSLTDIESDDETARRTRSLADAEPNPASIAA